MKLLIYIVFLAATSPTWEYSPRELEDKRLLVEGWKKMATQPLPEKNLDEYINKLGLAVWAASSSKANKGTERNEAYWLLRERLLSIPGHAEYYRDRINRMRSKVDKYRAEHGSPHGKYDGAGGGLSLLGREQRSGFRILENLPSVETVRVLGEFLSDDRGAGIPLLEQINTGETSNDVLAMTAISQLGIANAPTPAIRVSEDMDRKLEGWKHWYAEVKEGRRTFRFIGDPVDYDLRGPSKRGALEPNRTRSGKRAAGDDGAEDRDESAGEGGVSPPVIGAILAGLFLLAAFWIYRRKQLAR